MLARSARAAGPGLLQLVRCPRKVVERHGVVGLQLDDGEEVGFGVRIVLTRKGKTAEMAAERWILGVVFEPVCGEGLRLRTLGTRD